MGVEARVSGEGPTAGDDRPAPPRPRAAVRREGERPTSGRAGRADSSARLAWGIDQNLSSPLVVGKGNVLYLSGWRHHTRKRVRRLSVSVDGVAHEVVNCPAGGEGGDRAGGFWVVIPFGPVDAPRATRLALRAELEGGETCEAAVGTLSLLPSTSGGAAGAPVVPASGGEPLVAVCMATYNPPPDLFASQVESLRGQTHRNWVCVVNDDCSDEERWEQVRETVAGDARFMLSRNPERLGFYRNFERCLELAPAGAQFVALADQDDYWRPEKIERCLAAFRPETVMVFSDLEVASPSGEVVARTLWAGRENNHTDLESLVFTNTVTGASMLFRAELLGDALPFPGLPGDSYHDHWLACVALAKGRVEYVNRPLHVWRQHGGNACGFAATQAAPVRPLSEAKTLLRLLVSLLRGTADADADARLALRDYFLFLVKTAALARALRSRVPDAAEEKRAALGRVANCGRSLRAASAQALRYYAFGRPTLGRELICLRAALSVRLLDLHGRLARLFRRRPLRRDGAAGR